MAHSSALVAFASLPGFISLTTRDGSDNHGSFREQPPPPRRTAIYPDRHLRQLLRSSPGCLKRTRQLSDHGVQGRRSFTIGDGSSERPIIPASTGSATRGMFPMRRSALHQRLSKCILWQLRWAIKTGTLFATKWSTPVSTIRSKR